MNHLAHTLLAGDDEYLRLGGMLGDFVHGTLDASPLPARVIDGIRLHRAIDVYTDSHAEVRAARERFEPPYRRYAGILLDIWFDHCLALDFARWSATPLELFSDDLRALLHRQDALLPAGLQRFRSYMDVHDLPATYADPVMIGRVLHGLAQRLRHDNPIGTALPPLLERRHVLQQHYTAFFPQLVAFARDWRAERDNLPS
jgi:acyl carrier protein phosphodiesterase